MYRRIQRGRGTPIYRRVQRGRGLGGILSSIFRVFSKAVPIAAKIASSPTARKIGKEVLQSGLRVGGEALVTNDLNSALKNELNGVKQRVGNAMLKRGNESSLHSSKKMKKRKVTRKLQTGRGKKKTRVTKKTKKNLKKSALTKKRKMKNSKKKVPRKKMNIFYPSKSGAFTSGQRGSGTSFKKPRQRPTIFDM